MIRLNLSATCPPLSGRRFSRACGMMTVPSERGFRESAVARIRGQFVSGGRIDTASRFIIMCNFSGLIFVARAVVSGWIFRALLRRWLWYFEFKSLGTPPKGKLTPRVENGLTLHCEAVRFIPLRWGKQGCYLALFYFSKLSRSISD
jgi:hypothetical protein